MNILTVGGSDPSSGAGIQSDIRTFSDFDAYGLTVITAITSQNTKRISNIEPVSKKSLKSQLDLILSDFHIDAIKIGMVYNSDIINMVNSKFRHEQVPIIVDPIIKSTTGTLLLKKNAISDFKKKIISLADIITPNLYEAKILSGTSNVKNAAKKIQTLGAKSVIITGISKSNGKISDYVLEKDKEYEITGKMIPIRNHGSGCNYSASLTVSIAKQYSINQSVKISKKYVYDSIKNSKNIGKGIRITHQKSSAEKMELLESINNFKQIKNSYKIIPECQTNFVLAKKRPKTLKDILGVSGRLVKSGKEVLTVGEIIYGGSHHVGTAVIEVNKKFPSVCSAINIKFDPKIISKAKNSGFVVLSYDRKKEPKKSKHIEGSSIKWGINFALKTKSPDLIYHKGDVGKEPMILVFGETSTDVLKKLSKIIRH